MTTIDAHLREKLRNDADDVAAARAVLLAASTSRRDYGIDARDDATFTVRLAWNECFTCDDAKRLRGAHVRVVDVTLLTTRRFVHVEVRRAAATASAAAAALRVYAPPRSAGRKRRTRATQIDWTASGVDDDDAPRLDAITDAVYHMHERMPPVRMWLEPIDGTRAGGVAVVVRPSGGDDESESVVAAAATCVGYALCFVGFERLSGAFIEWLRAQHGDAVARQAVWLPPDKSDADAVYVVNVARVRAPDASATRAPHATRGDPVPHKDRLRIVAAPAGNDGKRARV